MKMLLTPQPFRIQLPYGMGVQDNLALQTEIIDSNCQKLKERIDRDDHGQRL